MKISERVMSLFPVLYSRRGESAIGFLKTRDWEAVRSPHLRLIGPNWSFTSILAKLDNDRYDLATLDESEVPQSLTGKDRLHRPVYLRGRISDVLGKPKKTASRYSVAAVNVLTKSGNNPRQLFANKDAGTSPIDDRTGSLILSSFGRTPYNAHKGSLYLPACLMLVGEIWTNPDKGWCDAAREALGLEPPEDGDDDRDKLVLLPDGLALRGRVRLPWKGETESDLLSGWFKLVPRRDGMPGGNDLRLWTERLSEVETRAWETEIDVVQAIVQAMPEHGTPPRWFDMATTASIGVDSLRWPCRADHEVLLYRGDGAPLQIVSDALRVRMGAVGEGRGGRLSVRPEYFTIAPGKEGGIVVGSDVEAAETPETGSDPLRSDIVYAFEAAAAEEGLADERVDLGRELAKTGEPDVARVLDLALPQIANATRLRDRMDFDDPPAVARAEDENLWLFTPLRSGWLHWAFPNMTVARADMTLSTESVESERWDADQTYATAGLWSMSPGPTERERAWALTFANAKAARFRAEMARTDGGWRLVEVRVTLADLSVTMDGLVPVTAFSQTAERLLPERADRALKATGLNARTPNLLDGAEAKLWDHGVKVAARVEGLRMRPPEGAAVTGAVFDTSSEREGAAPRVSLAFDRPTAAGDVPSLWLWSRHETLPSFQSMPLATTGAADRQPSSLRELAPLVLPESAADGLSFDGVFDMAAPGPDLVLGAEAEARHPMAGVNFAVEFGQAITTLPTVTLAPGLGAEEGTTWSGVTTPLAKTFRHDVALTDEYYTLAKLPPPAKKEGDDPADDDPEDEPEDDTTPPTVGFVPLPYNAPGTWPDAAWGPVWAGHLRALALSATAARDLFTDGHISDVFFGSRWLAGVTVDAEVRMAGPDGEAVEFEPSITGNRLLSAGRLTVSPDGAEPMVFDGLPATTDLTGLTLTNEDFDITRGALAQYSVSVGGTDRSGDQAGWAFGAARTVAGMMVRDAVRQAPTLDGIMSDGHSHRQVGLVAPLVLDGSGPKLQFHFRDVVVEEEPKEGAGPLAFELDRTLDGSQPNTALEHGFMWTLAHAGDGAGMMAPGHVLLRWLLFEPLELRRVEVAQEDSAFLKAVVHGRIALPGDGQEVVQGRGEAVLTIRSDGSWALEASDLALPLSDPDDRPGGPPLLMVQTLVVPSAGEASIEGARLDFALGSAVLSDALDEAVVEGGTLTLTSNRTTVVLPPLVPDEGATVAASHELALKLGKDGITLTLDQRYDLMTGEIAKNQDRLSFEGDSQGDGKKRVDVEVTATPTLAAGTLGVEWHAVRPSDIALLGLSVSGGNGTLLGRYDVDGTGALTAEMLVHLFTLSLGDSMRVDLDTTLTDPSPRVSAEVSGANLYSWPRFPVKISAAAENPSTMTIEAEATGRITHDVTIDVDRARVAASDLVAGRVRVSARAEHVLRSDDGSTLRWRDFQTVTLWASDALAEELRERADADTTYSLALQVAGKGGFRPGLIETSEAGHWALTPTAMRDLAKALDRSLHLMADISAHHFLSDGAPGVGRLRAMRVPGFVSAVDVDVNFAFTPPDGKSILRPADPSLEQGVPGLDTTTEARLRVRLQEAQRTARTERIGLGDALDPDTAGEDLRPLFQSVTAVGDGETEDKEHRFWAETALWLSAGLEAFADAAPRSAHTLAANGWVANELTSEEFALVKGTAKTSTVKTAEAHARSWGRALLCDVAETVMPAPPDMKVRPLAAQYQVIALDTGGTLPEVVARYTLEAERVSGGDGAFAEAAIEWASDVVTRIAPHARIALLRRVPLGELGPAPADAMALIESRSPGLDRTTRVAALSSRLRAAQRQRSLHPRADVPAGLSAGFDPAGTAVQTLSDRAGTLPEAGQTDLALTASGAAFASVLPSGTRHIPEAAVWLTSREVTPFRPETEFANGERLTPALPPETTVASPAALLSVRAADARLPAPPSAERSVVPPVISDGKIAPRSGVWMGHRLGLTSADPETRWSASERPTWIRTPRPVELGVNDRTVASAFEPRPIALSGAPEAVIFGPAVPRSILSPGDGGLNRRPRAADATLVRVVEPAKGLIGDDWTGSIRIEAETISDEELEKQWIITRAELSLGGDVYVVDPNEALGSDLLLSEFSPVGAVDKLTSAAAYARALPSGTPCDLWLTCVRDGAPIRRIGFRLWRAGERLIEDPVHVRFEDPAYNDRLTGLPKLARRDVPQRTDEILLLAEAGEVRPGAYVETGLALAPKAGGGAPALSFESDDNGIYLADGDERRNVELFFEVRRPEAEAAIEVGFTEMELSGSGPFASVPLRLSALGAGRLPSDNDPRFVLKDKDQFVITARFEVPGGSGSSEAISLTLDVVDRPLLPPNPAVYHLLGLDMDGARLSAPLQVTSPDPSVIELVDPKEMASGIVRRRAIYQWATFLSAEERRAVYSLQKTAATGASWLSNDIDTNWTKLN